MTQRGVNSYREDAILTASPQRLVVMLYDRMLLDCERAIAALDARDLSGAHHALVHAQDIVRELANSLDLTIWPEGRSLRDLYERLHQSLIDANVGKDRALVVQCQTVIAPLAATWREIAGIGVDAA